ncbi:MAG: extracellular solute-binding protein [Anaerolineae bacterium]|nr:extracellular solute-binding protein [Anaerolineae bacterium]
MVKLFAFPKIKQAQWRKLAGWLLGASLVAVIAFYGGQTLLSNARGPVRLVVYAFSTQEEVLTQKIFPAFEQAWEADTGRDLTIEAVFGPSGTLAGQINLGAPADVALFSNEQHVNWLKVGRRVKWETQPVTVSYTPMIIVTRPGNPAGIADFNDLAQPGLRLLHANPRSSGAGDWAVLAEYGSALLESDDPAAAQTQLKNIWRNVRLLGPSARATLILFELGAGDALVTYEQDARLALQRGALLQIVIPPRTIVAQHVAVVVDANVTTTERPAAQALVNYLLSEAGQQAFIRYHQRPASLAGESPVSLAGETFTPLAQTFTVEDLGGWSRAYHELIETIWQVEIEPGLNLEPADGLPQTKGD